MTLLDIVKADILDMKDDILELSGDILGLGGLASFATGMSIASMGTETAKYIGAGFFALGVASSVAYLWGLRAENRREPYPAENQPNNKGTKI